MASKNPEVKYTKLFIDGQFVDSSSGKTFAVINPSNCKKICDVSEGDKEDVDKAVIAAQRAFNRNSEWRTVDASHRGHLLCKLACLIERDMEYLASLETLNNGKPYTEALNDMQFAAKCLRYYGGWADKIQGKTIPADGNVVVNTRLEPVGVVAQIIPWNYPVLMLAWKWGPALAAGCTLLLKPAEQTPLTALYIAQLTVEAGFPPGVVNVINGFGETAAAPMACHPHISKVAFTGSTEVGKLIMEQAAKSNLKRVSLELGGKNPIVVFPDADIDKAVDICYEAIYTNMGQCCSAGSRTFVHEKLYDEFVKKAVKLACNRKIGDPFQEGIQHGPQISQEQYEKILNLIDSGKKEGAKVVCGGKKWGSEGYFIEPTIFIDVDDDMRIAKEEIFGPVQTILKFNNMDELIERANKTCYGLTAGAITNDINTAITFGQSVQAGTVWINCYNCPSPQTPFGGYKQSGQGRELGEEALRLYLEHKTITIAVPQKNS